MAIPIKETPTLYGKDAERFIREMAANEKRDHQVEFDRAQEAFNRLSWWTEYPARRHRRRK